MLVQYETQADLCRRRVGTLAYPQQPPLTVRPEQRLRSAGK